LRGFLPAATHSAHFVRHPGLARGIARYLAAEAHEITLHMEQLRALGPFADDRAPTQR
jgi:predicted N-acyltransferase